MLCLSFVRSNVRDLQQSPNVSMPSSINGVVDCTEVECLFAVMRLSIYLSR